MSQDPAGGQMNHGTVEVQGPLGTSATTNTGGILAKSDKTRLGQGFPNSPMLGDAPSYTPAVVKGLQIKLISNDVDDKARSDAAGYWGFSAPESSEQAPSSTDMVFPAPDVSAVEVAGENAAPLASPYIPNLLPPAAFGDADDNPDGDATQGFEEAKTSRPPFRGSDLTNPSSTSAEIQSRPWRDPPADS